MVKKELRDAYPYIYAWHKWTMSYDYYIENLIRAAIADDAPHDAIYRELNGRWATYREILNPIAKLNVDSILEDITVS